MVCLKVQNTMYLVIGNCFGISREMLPSTSLRLLRERRIEQQLDPSAEADGKGYYLIDYLRYYIKAVILCRWFQPTDMRKYRK
jgi:hypothetical protein